MCQPVGIEKAREDPFCFRVLGWMLLWLRPQRSRWSCLAGPAISVWARSRALGCNSQIPVETISQRPAIRAAQVPCKLAHAVELPQYEAWGYHRGGGFIPTVKPAWARPQTSSHMGV